MELAEEEPDAAGLDEGAERPEDAFVPEGFRTVWDAWHALRWDRQYGAMGGETPIPFTAIDRWAARNCVDDADFPMLRTLVLAMDGEWLKIAAERARERAESERASRESGRASS